MAEIVKQVDDTNKVFVGLLILGLTGLLFLIVFGNLSGNLGFANAETSFVNESSGYALNATTFTLDGQSTANFIGLAVSAVHNATSGQLITSGNYTVVSASGTIVGSAGRSFNYTDVNVSYTVESLGTGGTDTTQVIENLTGGAVAFFSFSNVWFTLLAVVLLIIIVMSVIGVVQSGSKSSFSS